MPPTNSCPRCGRSSPSGVSFCPSCGSTLSRSGGKGWKLLIGAVALFAGLLWVSVLYTQRSVPARLAGATQPQALLGADSGAAQATQPASPPTLMLTTAQHLSEAKRALADGYKPNKDPRKTQWGEVAAAKWHLKAIATTAAEYREAQELLKEVARRERQIELARKKAEADEREGETVAAEAPEDDADEVRTVAPPTPAYSSPSGSTSARQSPPAGGSSSDYYTNSRGNKVPRPVFSDDGPPAGASAQCRDGSYSFSQSRRGTCSHHGGVSRWL
jgi:hypothetical protein